MLIACKVEINYSKRNASMIKFAAIDARREVGCDDEVGRRATVRPGERKLDRYDCHLTSSHRRRNRMYRARLAAILGEAVEDLLS